MGVNAKFVADFTTFYDAVTKADKYLVDFAKGADRAQLSLNRMTDAFSGRKIVQDATLMARAIEDVGGISKLTERELRQVAAQAGEATAKLKAMGIEVPPGLQKIADQTKHLNTSQTDLVGTLKYVAGAFGLVFSAQALVGFVGRVFDAASGVKDLAAELSFSAEGAQRFKFAVEQSGGTVESLRSAAARMNVVLAEGEKSTIQALKDAGLQFNHIRSLKPEAAFTAIVTAAQGMADPIKQAEVVTTLFGKSALDLLPGIREGMVELGRGATVMSDETVASLARAQDAWKRLSDAATIYSGEVIAAMLDLPRVAKDVTSSWERFTQFMKESLLIGPQAAFVFEHLSEAGKKAAQDIELVNPKLQQTREQLAEAERAAKRFAEAQANIRDLTAGTEGLNPAILQEIQYLLRLGATQSDVAAFMKVTAGAVKAVADEMKRTEDAIKVLEEVASTLWKRSLELTKANNAELARTTALYLEIRNAAVLANLEAKKELNARQGFDVHGNRMPGAGSPEAALAEYERKLRELQPGQDAQAALLWAQYLDAFEKATQAANAVAGAHDDAAKAGAAVATDMERASGGANAAAAAFIGAAFAVQHATVQFSTGLISAFGSIGAIEAAYRNAGIFYHGTPVPGRARGGSVSAGQPYLVGEQGPELFMPGASGQIVPNGGGVVFGPGSIVINYPIMNDPRAARELVSMFGAEVERQLRSSGGRLPVGV